MTKKRSERKEWSFKCNVVGKDVKVEQYTVFTESMGTNGKVVGLPLKKSCMNYECLHRNTSNCPL